MVKETDNNRYNSDDGDDWDHDDDDDYDEIDQMMIPDDSTDWNTTNEAISVIALIFQVRGT